MENLGRVENDEVLDNAGKASSVVCYLCAVVGTGADFYQPPRAQLKWERGGEHLPHSLELCLMKTNKYWIKTNYLF